MTTTAFRTRAVIALDDPDPVLSALLDHLEEHATVIRNDAGARLTSPFGTVDITRYADTVQVDVASGSAEILAMMKVFIAEHVFEFAGEAASVAWSGEGAGDTRPPQFQTLVVSQAFDVTPLMRRVVFACENAAAYAAPEAGYHVRLLLPPAGRPPRWPSLAADGRMEWPAGEDALTSRVYTIRSVDAATNGVAVDFVLHGGGGSPGADFARGARPGDVVGILGPGGDGAPDAKRLLLLGDEAALPAIARMAESLPADCRATVLVEVEDEREEQPIASAAAVELGWLHRRGTPPGTSDLLERALAARLAAGDLGETFIWAGCEQKTAARLRALLRSGLPQARGRHRIYGYWNRDGHPG